VSGTSTGNCLKGQHQMIIVHSAMHSGRIFFWGEIAELTKAVQKRKSSKMGPQKEKAERYYYGADMQDLVAVLTQAVPNIGPEKKHFHDLAVWLPTRAGQAIPSSPLIAEQSPGRGKIKLRSWIITTYRMEWSEAVDLLCTCSGKKVLAPGVVIGDDLRFWSEAIRFAGSLVARQQYLPSVQTGEDDFRAVWQPVYLGDDTEGLMQLAQRMPPSARALCEIASNEPPFTPAVDALRRFVGGSLDCLVRHSSWDERSLSKRGNQANFESIHDAWLYALRSRDNRIPGPKKELALLAEQLREWSRPIAVTASSPFRLCFRLEEPSSPETPKKGRAKPASETWYVRYLLQPRDDLSLLIPMEAAWKQDTAKSSPLKQTGHRVTEYLLTSLGQASAVCPGVASSLKTSQPGGYSLDAQGAHEFLKEKALQLQQSGFGVMLPAWWTGKGTKLRLSVSANVKSPKMKATSGLSLGEIVQFDWEVSVGDEKMTLKELEALARLKAPLVRIRGQ